MNSDNSLLNRAVGICVLIFPSMFILVPNGGDVVLLIMLVISLIYLIINRGNKIPYSVDEKKLLLVISAYIGLHLLSNFFIGSEVWRTDGVALFIILLPVFLHIRKSVMDHKYIIYGVLAGAFACFVIAVYQKYMLGMPRAMGFFKIIAFGGISITIALMCFWAALLVKSRKISLLMFCGFGLACSASLLSGSRGSWLAVFSGLVLLILFNPKAWTVKKRAMITLSAIVLISSSYALPIVQKRVDIAVLQFGDYFSHGLKKSTSVGLRLEVWRAALDSVEENPWMGIGSGNFNDKINELVNMGKVAPAITGSAHVHNEYLFAALHRGIPGLVSLLLIFLVPLYTFLKHYHAVRDGDKLLLGYGIVIIVSGMTMSLTDLYFQHHRESLFFALYIYLIYGLVLSGSDKGKIEKDLVEN
ncbi:MAG: O-antigen ligase family protein [Gammaproteobacteria bacterium]|nr:O-antigen ligase family protein [Gammaproteobacteria bacterium]